MAEVEGVPTGTASIDTNNLDAPKTTGSPINPTTTSNGSATATLQNAKDTAINTASSTLSSIQNSQAVQDLKSGPVGQTVSKETTKASSELKDVYASRSVPEKPAATGQPLTQYHSMFYRLLSWQNPRATAITFASIVGVIFTARYLNVLHYAFKLSYFILGVTASLEIAGKMLFDDGLASKMRPRKYWTIPRESLERSLGDVEQLLNFFVIEGQRILYAENVYATLAVFAAAFLSYWLIKLIPFWGLCLLSTCVTFLGPLIYVKNQEAIDGGIEQVHGIVSSQATQIKNITAEHTGKATESIKSYAGEYSSKASGLMGQAKSSAKSAAATTSDKVSGSDFPAAPKEEPVTVPAPSEPLAAH